MDRVFKICHGCRCCVSLYQSFPIGMAADFLAQAAQQELTKLDEKLYLQAFDTPAPASRKSA